MTTFQKVQHLVADRHIVRHHEITLESSLLNLGIDSLATLELLLEIEETFGIRVSDTTRPPVTVGDLVSLIDRQLSLQCLTSV
jgi:acyl carrier protein